jgi:hypothetical protein
MQMLWNNQHLFIKQFYWFDYCQHIWCLTKGFPNLACHNFPSNNWTSSRLPWQSSCYIQGIFHNVSSPLTEPFGISLDFPPIWVGLNIKTHLNVCLSSCWEMSLSYFTPSWWTHIKENQLMPGTFELPRQQWNITCQLRSDPFLCSFWSFIWQQWQLWGEKMIHFNLTAYLTERIPLIFILRTSGENGKCRSTHRGAIAPWQNKGKENA